MATLISSPATVSVTSFPYSLPTSPGQVVAIGVNVPSAIRPAPFSANDWDYGLFGYFGGGVFVPNYSAGGAFVIAGSGGHDHPPNHGAAIFDFADATWKRKDNANGMPYRAIDYGPGEILYPQGEIAGANPPHIPSPGHRYAAAKWFATGGGAQGKIITLCTNWQGNNPATNFTLGASFWAHSMDLNTGLWQRASTNVVVGARHDAGRIDEFFSSTYDAALNRYYLIHRFQGGNALDYLDGNDMTWKEHNVPFPFGGEGYTQGCFVDDARHMLVVTVGYKPPMMFGLDLDNPTGWQQLSLSGAPVFNNQQQWAFYPPNGCYYTRHDETSSVLFKLTPPSSVNPSNPFQGTWTFSQITVGATLPGPGGAFYQPNQGVFSHNRLFYVPAIQCLAWIPGGDRPVFLIKPL